MDKMSLPTRPAGRDRLSDLLETTLRDFGYGCRTLLRSPGFALVVIATLAVGIGANVTMFSVMHAVLWKALPYPEPDRLVVIQAEMKGVTDTGLSPGELQELTLVPHARSSRWFRTRFLTTVPSSRRFLPRDGSFPHDGLGRERRSSQGFLGLSK